MEFLTSERFLRGGSIYGEIIERNFSSECSLSLVHGSV